MTMTMQVRPVSTFDLPWGGMNIINSVFGRGTPCAIPPSQVKPLQSESIACIVGVQCICMRLHVPFRGGGKG